MSRVASVLRLTVILIALTALAAGFGTVSAQEFQFFRIGTASTGGTYFPVGGMVANAISNPPGSAPCEKGGSCGVPGVIAVAQATAGSVENLALLRRGLLEAALAQANVASWAFSGSMIYRGKAPFEDLRAVGALYAEAAHLVVAGAGPVRDYRDLRGKSVSIGEEGSGSQVDARMILRSHGLGDHDYHPQFLRPALSAELLIQGKIDAFFVFGGPPFAVVTEAAERMPIRLLDIQSRCPPVPADDCFYTAITIPAGTYPGVGEVNTQGVAALLVVRADLPEDLVYGITRALWHDRNRIIFDNNSDLEIRRDHALVGLSIPLHDGARRYYREIGLIVNEGRTAQDEPIPAPAPRTIQHQSLPEMPPPG